MGKSIDVLPAVTDVQAADLLYLRRASEPIATADKQIAAANFVASARAYGQLYLNIATTVPPVTITGTPSIITAYDNTQPVKGFTGSDTAGTLTLDAAGGVYQVTFSVSFEGSANVNHIMGVYINGAATGMAGFADLQNNSVDAATLSASGIVTLTTGDVIDLRAWTDGANSDVQYETLILTVTSF